MILKLLIWLIRKHPDVASIEVFTHKDVKAFELEYLNRKQTQNAEEPWTTVWQ